MVRAVEHVESALSRAGQDPALAAAAPVPRTADRGAGRRPPSGLTPARREALFGWAMVSIALLAVLVFTALPIVASFVLAFFKWDAIGSPRFVGLDNFRTLVDDSAVTHSIKVTLVLAVLIVTLQVVVGL